MPSNPSTSAPAAIPPGLVPGFRQRYDAQPTLVTRAPGRVNLIGEHVDYQAGLCLPVALSAATYVAARPRADGLLRLGSLQDATTWQGRLADVAPGTVDGWAAYVVGVLRVLADGGFDVPGLDLLVDSTVPVGAGLSSSAALECAVAAVAALEAGRDLDDPGTRRALARAGIRAEREYAGAPTGGMDQMVAMFGRSGHALLLDCRDDTLRHVPLHLGGAELLVVDTRVRHALVDGQYAARREQCDAAARELGVATLREVRDASAVDALEPLLRRRARHVVSEIGRTARAADLLEAGRVDEVGELLLASHASLRDDFEVSCAELDVAVEAASEAGALGARMTGGGFGGSMLALLPAGRADQVVAAVTDSFARHGFGAPAFLPVLPSDGAGSVPLP